MRRDNGILLAIVLLILCRVLFGPKPYVAPPVTAPPPAAPAR